MNHIARGLILLTMATALAPAANAVARFTGAFKPEGPYVSGGANFHFRVQGLPGTANCSESWAYVNEADSGAKGKMATLLMAYSMGRNIDLLVDTGSGGYCQILEVVMK